MAPSPNSAVLILENEPVVLRSTARMLRNEGYEVYEAASPQEARTIVERTPRPISLLICDLELDGLQGREAVIMLQAIRPEMRVLFMSGSDGAHFRVELEREHRYFLRKPFARTRLLECVSFVLEGWQEPIDASKRSA